MALKSRILPKAKPDPVPRVVVDLRPLRQFTPALNLKTLPRPRGEPPSGWHCTASWEVLPAEDQILAFLELEERLGQVRTLYHGTSNHNIHLIAKEGLKPGKYGMFGAGIYLGRPNKCIHYTGGTWAWKQDERAYYLLEVQVLLGQIKECLVAEKWSRKKLSDAGFDSVAGVANLTVGWRGALHNDEFVVYDRAQVLVRYVHEYRCKKTAAVYPTSGTCDLIVNKGGVSGTFADILGKKPCDKTAYNRLSSTSLKGRNRDVWLCADCVTANKIRHGSKIVVKTPSVHDRQSSETVVVR